MRLLAIVVDLWLLCLFWLLLVCADYLVKVLMLCVCLG